MTSRFQQSSDVLVVHHLFERVANERPDSVAIVCGSNHLTYLELDRRANGFLWTLKQHGIGAESRVALCLGRVPEMVIAMLATLKAGAAYVPLDPVYPEERLSFMLMDSGAQVLVKKPGLQKLSDRGIPVLMVPEDEEHAFLAEQQAMSGLADPRSLAWIIYTSGSTGQPKGVGIEHRGAVALAQWSEEEFQFHEMTGVLASTSWCFDLSAFEIWVTLLRGGTAIIVDNVLELDNIQNRDQVTLINSVPVAVLELVLQGGIPRSVETICLAGEPLARDLVNKLYALPHIKRVLNLYGPTEDTTYSTWATMRRDDPEKPSIGVAITGSFGQVLDENGMPAASGAIGELYLGGAGLARGYIGNPAITAEKFVPDAHGVESGGRLYRTGDLVRILPDGNLEFIGRVDHQVKIRGLRIELGEIEKRLEQHESVQDAVVMAREKNGDKHLVGYVLVSKSAKEEAGKKPLASDGKLEHDLQDYLRGVLPQFMVPSAIMVLPVWPLTLNGKVDRKRLPEPEFYPATGQDAGPLTAMEKSLVGIWQDVLHINQIGVQDNFFHLGGHSLAATRIISRLRKVFGINLSLQSIFENPTIAQLRTAIEELSPAGEKAADCSLMSARELPVTRVGEGEPLPLSYGQQRMWLSVQMNPASAAFNVFMPLRWSGAFFHAAATDAVNEIVRRHGILRSTFEAYGDQPVQRMRPHVLMKIPIVDLSGLSTEQRRVESRRVTLAEGGRLFDLGKDRMIRVSHLLCSHDEHILLVTTHHIATDGESAEIFADEFATLYQLLSQGRPAQLQKLHLQYADFALRQREWLAGSALDNQREYWKQQLQWAPREPALPTDHPRGRVASLRGGYEHFDMPAALLADISRLGATESATLFMTLLAVLATFLYRISGEQDWVIGTDIANRMQPSTETLIGFMVNVLALRNRISRALTFRQLLRNVRQTVLDAFAHQDLPFGEVLKLTGRDETRAPLFQVFFVLQHEVAVFRNIPGITVTEEVFDNKIALRELSLYGMLADGGLRLAWNYRTELFEASTVQRWIRNFLAILQHVCLQPDCLLDEISLTPQSQPSQQKEPVPTAEQARFKRMQPKAVDLIPRV